jgi:hypothetical protein
LEGQDEIYENGRPVQRGELQEINIEYAPAVRFFDDWDRGMFQLGLTEYLMMPVVLTELRKVYVRFKNELAAEREKALKNAHK